MCFDNLRYRPRLRDHRLRYNTFREQPFRGTGLRRDHHRCAYRFQRQIVRDLYGAFCAYSTNQKTAIAVAEARGVILLAARQNNVPIFEYTPLEVKQSVVGYGRAEKQQVQAMIKVLLNLDAVPKPDDTADALAMAVCHAHTSGSVLGRLNSI